MDALRLWLSSLTTPLIAILGIWIAYQQYKLQRYKLRKDVSEARIAIFFAVKNLLQSGLKQNNPDIEAVDEFNLAVAGSTFLFGPEITNYLDTLRERYLEMWSIAEQKKENDFTNAVEEKEKLIIKRDHKKWMREQLEDAEKLFKKYLDLSKA